jgi:stage II sporulation protein E
MQKLSAIGLARGKLTLVDLPVEFTRNCSFSNNILYSYNEQISRYLESLKLTKAFSDETELLGLQTNSIANVLKEFACDYSKTLNFHSETESKILKSLHHSGIKVSEIMVLGEGEDCEINIVLDKSDYQLKNLTQAISQGVEFEVTPTKTINLSQTHIAVCYKIAPRLDAVFGLSQVAKNGKTSGDTHSLVKLGVGRFIVAINDGMGSGEKANHVSSIATSLLESFFKAGLNSTLALKTVNKVLTVTSGDTFTALDLAIIDLYKGFAEFIKIGSPYGYLIERDNIKIIEAKSLPMGITDLDFCPAQSSGIHG